MARPTPPVARLALPVPATLEQLFDPDWFSRALAHLGRGPVAECQVVETREAMAAKVRLLVHFADDGSLPLCAKGFFAAGMAGAAAVTRREGRFYADVAPHLELHLPACYAVVSDPGGERCVLLLADLAAAGAHFPTALEPLTPEQVAETLGQLAHLHATTELLANNPWLGERLPEILASPYPGWSRTQALMHDARRGDLPADTLDAERLRRALERLAAWAAATPHSVLHGDGHPGNLFRFGDGRLGFLDWQLVHRGPWALDVAYHLNAALPVEVAEREERALLDHYLAALARHGGRAPSFATAWEDYRRALPYGFYHWCITQRVRPEAITHETFRRLGWAVTRHQSYRLLGA
ncbi:MAG: aminoglycoside phosphotransferase [Porticoccaceae bacterium]|nr:MAG: aminoglycoside phosphotransferase [Porticoccaceae bacterium]